MESKWWESPSCWICDYWWGIAAAAGLVILTIVLLPSPLFADTETSPTSFPDEEVRENNPCPVEVEGQCVNFTAADLQDPQLPIPEVEIHSHPQGNFTALYIEPAEESGYQPQFLLVQEDQLSNQQTVYLDQESHVTYFENLDFSPEEYQEVASFSTDQTIEDLKLEVGEFNYMFFLDPTGFSADGTLDEGVFHVYQSPFDEVMYVWLETSRVLNSSGLLASPVQNPRLFLGGMVGGYFPWGSIIEHIHLPMGEKFDHFLWCTVGPKPPEICKMSESDFLPGDDFVKSPIDDEKFTLEPNIDLLSPSGGEVWEEGELYRISWDAVELERIDIALAIGGKDKGTIASNIDAELGFYDWRVPEGFVTDFGVTKSENVLLRVMKSGNWSIQAENQYPFTIQAGKSSKDVEDVWPGAEAKPPQTGVVLQYPQGGEAWQEGDQQRIFWDATGVEKIDLVIELSGGKEALIRQDLAAERGYYDWIIPDGFLQDHQLESPADVFILVKAAGDVAVYDRSSAPLEISGDLAARDEQDPQSEETQEVELDPELTLLSPHGDEVWKEGEEYRLIWKAVNVDQVDLIAAVGGKDMGPIADKVDAEIGYYDWLIPDGFISDFGIQRAEHVRVQVADSGNPELYDETDNYFTITAEEQYPEETFVTPEGLEEPEHPVEKPEGKDQEPEQSPEQQEPEQNNPERNPDASNPVRIDDDVTKGVEILHLLGKDFPVQENMISYGINGSKHIPHDFVRIGQGKNGFVETNLDTSGFVGKAVILAVDYQYDSGGTNDDYFEILMDGETIGKISNDPQADENYQSAEFIFYPETEQSNLRFNFSAEKESENSHMKLAEITLYSGNRADGQPVEQGFLGFVEEFDDPTQFTATDPDVYISDGKVFWEVSRSGGEQFVYREIEDFSGGFKMTVTGQTDQATNNCSIKAGIGDQIGEGIAVRFGYFGGGCSERGYLVNASGVSLDHGLDGCDFTGSWLWGEQGQSYTASLIVEGEEILLDVPKLGSVNGTLNYDGGYSLLYVGLNGKGDWPECAGVIDRIVIEPLN